MKSLSSFVSTRLRYYDSHLFLERLAGSYSYGRPSAHRNRRVTTLVEPNQFFQIFQPILKTRKNHGTCCYNRSYDTNTEERLGVIDITVDGSWARPDQTVETIIEEYLSTEFEVPAINCIDCQLCQHRPKNLIGVSIQI